MKPERGKCECQDKECVCEGKCTGIATGLYRFFGTGNMQDDIKLCNNCGEDCLASGMHMFMEVL